MHTDINDLMDKRGPKLEIDGRYLGYSYVTNADGTYSIIGRQGQIVQAIDADESIDLGIYLAFAAKRGKSKDDISSYLCMNHLDTDQY